MQKGGRFSLGVVLLVAAFAISTTSESVPRTSDAASEPRADVSFSAKSDPMLEQAFSRLDDDNRRFRVLLIGDSTGVDRQIGWQQLTMQWLAQETGRPWTLHSWVADPESGEESGYAPAVNYPGDADKAPLVMWNASAAGRAWRYTAARIGEMAHDDLRRVDLILVNHGHNVSPAREYEEVGYPVIDTLKERFPKAAVVVFTQNPVRGDAPLNAKNTRKYVDRYHDSRDVPLFHVYRTFERSGRLDELVDAANTRHPTDEGHRVWFELVKSRLGPALSQS